MINTTNITDATNFLQQTTALNDAAGASIFTFVLFAIFGVVLIVFMNRGFKEAFIGAAAMTSLLGVIFWSLELISFSVVIIPIILMFVGVVTYIFTKD